MTVATWPTFMAELRNQKEVAERTIAFYFEKPTGWSFKAGQFIDITVLEPSKSFGRQRSRIFNCQRSCRRNANACDQNA